MMSTSRGKPQPVFLDTAYVYALINTRDEWHGRAAEWKQKIVEEERALVTTELILIEIADGLAAVKFRQQALQVIDALRASPFINIIPASSELFHGALELYRGRADKDWGLTDCASFVVMRERGLYDALTVDDHFRQAGFRALLLDAPE